MKKFVSILLILVLVLSLCACGGAKGPKGSYTAYYYGSVFSTVTFNSDGTFTEKLPDEPDTWYGTWVIDGSRISCTYDDGSHDSYIWNSKDDTLDWKGEGEIIYKHN